jgi:cell division protein FtsL
MTRLNLILLIAMIGCALSVVTSQHKARKMFMALQGAQEGEQKLDQEWRELQIESQTLGRGKLIEQKATRDLGMTQPDPKKTVIVVLGVEGQAATVAAPAATGNAEKKK